MQENRYEVPYQPLQAKDIFYIVSHLFIEQPFSMNYNEEMHVNCIRNCSIKDVKKQMDPFYEKNPTYNTLIHGERSSK